MLNLSLLEELDVDEVGEAEGVEAGVTGHVFGEVLRLGQERDGRGVGDHDGGGGAGRGDDGQARPA